MSMIERDRDIGVKHQGTMLFNEPLANHQGSASAADIEALIHLVQTKVREQTTVELIHEVYIIGDC